MANNSYATRDDTSGQGKAAPLTIHDISEYIHTNSQFINQVHINTFDDSDFENENAGADALEPLNPGREALLTSLPKNLNQIFSTYKFTRKGVMHEVRTPADTDVSFVSCLLSGCVDKYDKLSDKTKVDLTEKLIRKCHKEYQKAFENLKYKELGWKLAELRKIVSNLQINRSLLRYYVDTLYVNLFILDIDNDRLAYVGSETYVKFKRNIFILKYEGDRFELVFDKSTKRHFFHHSDGIIKKLVNSSFCVEKLDCNYANDDDDVEFVIGDGMDISSFEEDESADENDGENDGENANKNADDNADADVEADGDASDKDDESSDGNNFEEGEQVDEVDIAGITEVAEFSETDTETIDISDVESNDVGSDGAESDSAESDNAESDNAESDNAESDSGGSDDASDEVVPSMTMKREELVNLADKRGIDLRYRKGGKWTNKTKKMLCDELLASK